MLPPSSTVMSSGPRRAVKVAPLLADLPLPLNQTTARRRRRRAAPIRQRGWFLMKGRILFGFSIVGFLPLPLVFDVENAQIDPELQPGNRVTHQGLCALI